MEYDWLVGGFGGYWGAKYGPRLIRRALHSGRSLAFAGVLVSSLLTVFLFGQVYVTALIVWADGFQILAVCFGLGANGAVLIAGEAALRWWWKERRHAPATISIAPSGIPAMAYQRSRASLFTPIASALMWAAYGTAIAVSAAMHDNVWLAPPFALLAAFGLSMLVPFALGRVSAGGIYLTPDGVEHRFGLRTAFVPWGGFYVPGDELPFHLLLGPGAWQRKSFPWVIPVDVNDRVGRGRVAVPTQYLPISSADLVAELRTYSLTRRNLQPFSGHGPVSGVGCTSGRLRGLTDHGVSVEAVLPLDGQRSWGCTPYAGPVARRAAPAAS